MPVRELAVTEYLAPDSDLRSFALHRSQRIGMGALALLLIALAVILYRNADNTVNDLRSLSDEANSVGNVLLAQHESLQFASSFERWLAGTTTRSNLQIRRAELAQKLEVSDNTGVLTSERVGLEYLEALRNLDGYMGEAPFGLLPHKDQVALRSKSHDTLDSFIMQAREMAVSSSGGFGDPLAILFQNEISRQNFRNAALLVALTLVLLAAGFIAFSHLADLRRIRVRMVDERRKLEETNVALQRVDGELQLRLERERVDRAEHEWLDSSVRSISSQFKSTIVPDKIAEALVEGLGRALGVELVLFYSFPNFPMQRLWKQWHQKADSEVEESLVIENESELFKFAEILWNKKRSAIVNDSHLLDLSSDPIPILAAVAQMRARSWVMVPLGTGSQVLGCLGVGMWNDIRVWSAVEIELIQRVVSEVTEVFIQARLFRQSMQIAENDAEVGRLVELDKVKNNFIENMNHELRTPLTSIIGYMEVVMDDVDSSAEPELASSLVAVQRNATRLQSLIENMMQLSKTDFQHLSLDVATVDIGRLLDDVLGSMELGAKDCGVTLVGELDSPAGDLMVDGDIGQLEQVFVNLMSNAIKFTPRGGTVTVAARSFHADRDFVEVKVTDTGIGIPPEEFPNMFKRFFRASTASQASIPGFGIGLSLVRSIVREHHGTITFDSTVGKGTVFTVTLPARYVFAKPTDTAI